MELYVYVKQSRTSQSNSSFINFFHKKKSSFTVFSIMTNMQGILSVMSAKIKPEGGAKEIDE
jgi:hypothetical protein